MKSSVYHCWTVTLVTSFWLGACGSVPLGASDANYARAQQVSTNGAALFGQHCASCHGERGQGKGGAPSIMGAGALPKYPRDASDSSQRFTDPQAIQTQVQTLPPGTPSREPFNTAQDVFNYVKTHMPLPKERIGSLSDEEYWAVVTFVLAGHGAPVPEGGVNQANAPKISVQP